MAEDAAAATTPVDAAPGQPAAADEVDLDALAERVYQRLLDELRLERERASWLF
jgi:hypothetical protein